MNKNLKKMMLVVFGVIALVLAWFILFVQPNKTEAPSGDPVTVELVFTDGEVVEEKTVEITEGDTLSEVLEENYEVVEEDGFLSAVEGVIEPEADEQEFIAIYVDDEMAMVGMEELKLEDGDVVDLTVETWE